MTLSVIHIILLVIAVVLIIAAIIFILQARQRRTRFSRAAYNVGRQEARLAMQLNLMRALVALAVGLVLFGVYLLLPSPSEAELFPPPPTVEPSPAETETLATETAVSPTNTAVPSLTPIPTDLATVAVSTLTPVPTSFPRPAPAPTETATAQRVKTAVVTSGVGVWLRSAPSVDGEQVEWLFTQTEVIVLEGQATADEFEWQQVQAPSGNVGWVAVPFIEFVEP